MDEDLVLLAIRELAEAILLHEYGKDLRNQEAIRALAYGDLERD